MEIRLENRTDFKEVELLIRESFWNIYRPGCYEHFIIHNLRHDASFVPKLDYVIEEDGKIIANIVYSTSYVIMDDHKEKVVTLGPLSVHPDYQKQGYGTKLIEYTLKEAEDLGIPFIFVIGDENYYTRFGFEKASKYGIMFEDKTEAPFFMVKVFNHEKIISLTGVYKNNDLFNVNKEELEKFDKNFPPKEKEKRENHLNF